MQAHPLRLAPGEDLRAALMAVLHASGMEAAFVLQAIGSLSVVRLRLASRADLTELTGEYEILTLAGTLSPDGPHLHMSVADSSGAVLGGHVGEGCLVRTTAEVLLALLPGHRFSRQHDPATGYPELGIVRSMDGG